MPSPAGTSRLAGWAAWLGRLFAPAQIRRRRIEARAKAAAEALVRVGDVAIPFKDIVAAGLIMRRVPQRSIHAGVQDCIRQAVEAAESWVPGPLRNRMVVEEVTRESMRWREQPGDVACFHRTGLARGPARDSARSRRSRSD